MRTPTDYRKLHNRCPKCGHRTSMHVGTACAVVNSDIHNRSIEHPCRCPKAATNV